jgi:hypothetical protein
MIGLRGTMNQLLRISFDWVATYPMVCATNRNKEKRFPEQRTEVVLRIAYSACEGAGRHLVSAEDRGTTRRLVKPSFGTNHVNGQPKLEEFHG